LSSYQIYRFQNTPKILTKCPS
jgi:translation initiation factor 3 subunit J